MTIHQMRASPGRAFRPVDAQAVRHLATVGPFDGRPAPTELATSLRTLFALFDGRSSGSMADHPSLSTDLLRIAKPK